jgi:hypothetical protein
MMKMLITLDENKIIAEGKYNLNKIMDYIDKACEKRGMTKDSSNWYSNGDFTSCGSLILVLKDKEWFINNLKEWLWYDSDDNTTEDLKSHYAKEKIIA